jgi:DNA (cytosine-5)-methyltransferase 1
LHQAVRHPSHVIKWLWDVKEGHSAHDNENPKDRPPSGYNTTYKRQVWQEPASTVQTTFGMISGCRNVHPISTRSLTIREAARIQSFPDSYQFTGTLGAIRTGIGNAVPPLLAYRVGLFVRSRLLNLVEVARL